MIKVKHHRAFSSVLKRNIDRVCILRTLAILSFLCFSSLTYSSPSSSPSPLKPGEKPGDQYWSMIQQRRMEISSCSHTKETHLDIPSPIPQPSPMYTIGVRIHLTHKNEQSTDDLKWLKLQFKEANLLFKQINVCFKVIAIQKHPLTDWHMQTRKQRTQLGYTYDQKSRLTSGQIDLFIVGRLDDVDRKDAQIRGVHWRDPKNRQRRRWVILSRIAQSKVLAHELGHYFSLPHSRYSLSIMNKTPRKVPMKRRGFVEQELKQMRQFFKKMRKNGHLIPL